MIDESHHTEAGRIRTPEPVSGSAHRPSGSWSIDSLLNMELPISISFGSLEIPLEDILKLEAGSVIELGQSADDPVTVIVNHKPIAKGEIVEIKGNYGIRILEVESTADRIRSLR